MANLAETYDLILSTFLERMLSRPDASNTVIVLRADHGLQAGPQTADYSIQVEALRPWTEIVVPKDGWGGMKSIESLFLNQGRLVTGPDLYRTLTSLMTGKAGK